jgi:hypothetical protein
MMTALGRYAPDLTDGITRGEDLPKPKVIRPGQHVSGNGATVPFSCPLMFGGVWSEIKSIGRCTREMYLAIPAQW